jgi:hypothetical protein
MGTGEMIACSAYPGTKALARAQSDLATAARSCEQAIRMLAPLDESRSHAPDLAFLSGMLSTTLAGLDIAGEMLADMQGDLFEQSAEALCDG